MGTICITNLVRGRPGLLQPLIDDIDTYWSAAEKAQAISMLTYAFVGSPTTVRSGLQQFVEQTKVDELIVAAAVYDHSARLRSYEFLAKLFPA